MSSVTGTVVSRPCITMPSESPTRMKSQCASTIRGRMGVIGGQADDRLAAFARADIGGGEPPDLVLDRHDYFPNTGTPITAGWKA